MFKNPHFQIEVKCETLHVFCIKTYFQVKDFAFGLVFKKSLRQLGSRLLQSKQVRGGAGDPMVAVTKRGKTCADSKS